MDASFRSDSCHDCPVRVVCRCLQITEDVIVEAFATGEIRTLKDLRQCTGAGDGCTACHAALRQYLEQSAVPAA
jgi:bacterioferritin-associated ferredoxin